MANPTTAKPSGTFAEWDSTAGTVGADLVCFDPMLPTGPRDVVGNVVGVPYCGGDGGSGGAGLGHSPIIKPGGFAFNGLSETTYKFGIGTTAIRYPNRGIPNQATFPQTVACVIKPLFGGGPATRILSVCSIGADRFGKHIGLQISTSGVITLGRLNVVTFSSAGVTLTSGKTYLISMTATSATACLFNVYCYDDDAYVTNASTGASISGLTSAAASNMNEACFNGGVQYNGYSSVSFIGEAAMFLASTATFDPAQNGFFAALVADPWLPARGSYAGGGALTAGGICTWDETTDRVKILSNRPSGGTPASYQCYLHRSETVSFAADDSTRVAGPQSSPLLEDTTASPDTDYAYRVEWTDGTSTVYSSTTSGDNNSQVFGRLSRGDFLAVSIGDSRWSSGDPLSTFVTFLRSRGWRCGLVGMSTGGSYVAGISSSLSWQPNTTQDPTHGQAGTTLLANAITAALNGGATALLSTLGVNDAANGASFVMSDWLTKYGYIRDVVLAAGLDLVVSPPYQQNRTGQEAQSAVVQQMQAAVAALDNGTTVRVLGSSSYDLSMSGVNWFSRDLLHYIVTIMDGQSVAHAWLKAFDPDAFGVATGGGGGGVIRVGFNGGF